MSIHEASVGETQAIGLGSTSMYKYLYNEISFYKHFEGKTFVLMLDNDKGGNLCREKLEEIFKTYNIPYIVSHNNLIHLQLMYFLFY